MISLDKLNLCVLDDSWIVQWSSLRNINLQTLQAKWQESKWKYWVLIMVVKMSSMSCKAIFVRYPEGTEGYRLYDLFSHLFICSLDVVFSEKNFHQFDNEHSVSNFHCYFSKHQKWYAVWDAKNDLYGGSWWFEQEKTKWPENGVRMWMIWNQWEQSTKKTSSGKLKRVWYQYMHEATR